MEASTKNRKLDFRYSWTITIGAFKMKPKWTSMPLPILSFKGANDVPSFPLVSQDVVVGTITIRCVLIPMMSLDMLMDQFAPFRDGPT